jgi:hypothetical protein
MARYRVLAKSFINNRIVEEGEEIDYDPGPKGHASANLEAVKGKKAKAEGDPEAAAAEAPAPELA